MYSLVSVFLSKLPDTVLPNLHIYACLCCAFENRKLPDLYQLIHIHIVVPVDHDTM